MRGSVIILVAIALCGCAFGQDGRPTQFEIGRRTFFDFGPPFDFYELFMIRPTGTGTSVERITLTPGGDACTQPPKIEVATGTLGQPAAELIGKVNPCTIPEKELRRELKRCKKCLVFSGANVAMQVRCGNQTRIIRADILDRDMFDPAPNTPKQTSWTMQLLDRLDQAVGPGVMDRPVFPVAAEEQTDRVTHESEGLRDISAGRYDVLFQGTPDKPSDLYRAALIGPPVPTIRLVNSTPFRPEAFVLPGYPPIARLARVEGTVNFTVDVNPDGSATNFTMENGHPMLRGVTEETVGSWKFAQSASGQRIHAAIEFATNCPPKRQ